MEEAIIRKLGMRPGRTLALIDAPPGFGEDDGAPTPDVIVAFVRDVAGVPQARDRAVPRYRRGACLWFAYPKKSGTLRSDLTRDHGWEPLAGAGLLPVSQVAIDDDWSALRFRFRDEIKTITRAQDLPGGRP